MNRIVEYSAPAARHVRGTRVEIGDTLYAIQHIPTKLYWVWSYTNRDMALKIADKVLPGHALDRAANWRASKASLTPSARKAD